ncbi:MAG: hypothetical protein V4850_16850 [Myxococcota bacterium]
MTLLALLLGCARNACEDWAAVALACVDEAGEDTRVYEPDAACPGWSSEAQALYGSWYRCQEDAWAAADCASAEGVETAREDAATCPAP